MILCFFILKNNFKFKMNKFTVNAPLEIQLFNLCEYVNDSKILKTYVSGLLNSTVLNTNLK